MPRGERIHALDSARAGAILLVVVLHGLIPFLNTDTGWAVHEPSSHLVIDGLVWIIHAFIMPLFFLLSGFFLANAARTADLGTLLRRRSMRLLIPLGVFLVPVSLAMNAMWDWGKSLSAARAQMAGSLPELRASEHIVTLGHLWFLYYLAAVTALALAGFALIRRFRPGTISLARLPIGYLPLAMSVPVALTLLWAQKLQLDTPLGFALDLPILAYHGLFFVWGWLLCGRRAELHAQGKHIMIYLALAGLSFAILIPVLVASTEPGHDIPIWAYWLSASFICSLITVLLGLCMRYAARPNGAIELSSRASYWTYVLHLPLLVLAQIVLYQTSWPTIVKFPAAVIPVLVLCILGYRWLVQNTWLARFMG